MDGIQVIGGETSERARVLTPEALEFIARLEREFRTTRARMLDRRRERRNALASGHSLGWLPETADVRAAEWTVAPAPADLDDRRVEITGPAERKMMINALNSGARVFMADLEDSLSPTWENVVDAQAWLTDAVHRVLSFVSPDGKRYAMGDRVATLVVRPRGWHLDETRVLVDDAPMSASLFDFGLHIFHNGAEALGRGSGPYYYLPKLESHLEARLWNEVFVLAQNLLRIPRGTIRATVLIETIWAAYEMDEILYELREHAAGLNAGRWDYLFSIIKAFRDDPTMVLPDRSRLTMDVPFMRAYARLLVHTCHRRGAHAIGGMAAFIPSRRDPQVNERALGKVREDKNREAGDGFDGTWVAHPDLVSVAESEFDVAVGERAHQKHRNPDVEIAEGDLTDLRITDARVTPQGVRTNIDVALQYIEAWLRGSGAVAIYNLMEDAATAEISRSQLWQWVRHAAPIAGEGRMSAEVYQRVRDEELARLKRKASEDARFDDAAELLDAMVLGDFEDFLTLPGYKRLVELEQREVGR
jgi:malate synthase